MSGTSQSNIAAIFFDQFFHIGDNLITVSFEFPLLDFRHVVSSGSVAPLNGTPLGKFGFVL
jgi:hypothetical protein